MNILHTEASCGWGGQEIRILTEARGMIARGHRVQLLCPAEARIHAEAPRYGVPVTALPIGRKNIGGMLALRAWLKANKIDVINTHSSTDTWLAALACASLRDAPPLVRTRHISATVPHNLPSRWLYRKASRLIVTTGESLRLNLINALKLDAERIVSIPTGIDTDVFCVPTVEQRRTARAALKFDAHDCVVGIVATLRSWKGHRYLIEAFAQSRAQSSVTRHRPMKLVIVGDGPQRSALEQQVQQDGLGEHVIFTGNRADVVPCLHAFDLFALPSYANEGVPQSLLQAMACGVPIITTDAGAISEIARHQDTAWIVAKENIAELASALMQLADDANMRQRLAANAVVLVQQRHGLDAMLDGMEVVFEKARIKK